MARIEPVATPRGQQRKRAILAAAARLFRDQGLPATGMRHIAAAAGMAVGNLYYYFADKGELLAFCQEDALAGLHQLVERVRAVPLDHDEWLYLLACGHLSLLHEGTPGSLAHLDVATLPPVARRAVVAGRDAYERAWRELLREGSERGIFRPLDPRIAAATILGALNWTAQWYRPDGGKSPSQLGEEMAELLLRGVLAPGVPLRRPRLGLPLEAGAPAPPDASQAPPAATRRQGAARAAKGPRVAASAPGKAGRRRRGGQENVR